MMRHNKQICISAEKCGPAWRPALILVALAMGTALSAQTCDPVGMPYTEKFNAVTTPSIPECMSLDVISGNPWETMTAPPGLSGKCAVVTSMPSGSPSQDTWLFTRGLNFTGGTSYRLTYKYLNNSLTYTEKLSVSFGTDASAAAMNTQLANHPNISTGSVQWNTVEFTPDADGVYYIGFKCYSFAHQNRLYLDDIKVQETPSCEEPTQLLYSNISISGASFSWSPSSSGPGDGYEWELRTSGAGGSGTTGLADAGTTPAGTTNGSSSILEPNTTYYLYVRSNCGQGDFSLWAEPVPFTTACISTNVPYFEDFNDLITPALPNCMSIDVISGHPWTSIGATTGMTGNAASISYTFGYPDQESWLFTQGLNLTAGTSYRLTYKYTNHSTNYHENLAVYYGSSNNGAAMTLQLADHPDISTMIVKTDTVEFTPDTDGIFYIGFKCYSIASQLRLYVDDIRVQETPTCEEPTALTASNITSSGADLGWTASATSPANGYQWEIRTSGDGGSGAPGLVDSGTTGAGNTTATTTMLDPESTYSLYVRGDCGTYGLSMWAGPYDLITACVPTDLPYTEDFDNVTSYEIPHCMSGQDIIGPPWWVESAPTGMTGKAAVVYYISSGNPDMDTWLFTQGLNLVPGTTYRLTYDYFNNATTTSENMAVFLGDSADAAAMTVPLADHPDIRTTTVQNGASTFTVETAGTYYIGFKCYSIPDQYLLYLDNIEVTAMVQCTELPDPGLTTGPNNACPSVAFTVGIENPPIYVGISYQWETSSDGTTWNNAGGADSLDTYTTTLTEDTWFRAQVTCDNTGTVTSTPLEVTLNDPDDCYCGALSASVQIEHITNVTYAGIANTSTGNTGGAGDYTDQVAQVTQGGTDILSVTIAATSGEYVHAFIDWNHNGIFNDAGEAYTVATYTSSGGPHNLPITVPLDAYVGITRMRVMVLFGTAVPEPCQADMWGEAEDYSVHVFDEVGIEEVVAKDGVAVYPNPASTELMIATANGLPIHVKVFDMVGHLVMERSTVNRLDITDLAPGSYGLVIIDKNGAPQARARFMKL